MNNSKKTIYFSSYDDIKNPHYGGGGAIAVHEVAKRLQKHFAVRVLSWNHSGKRQEIIDSVVYERFGFPFIQPKIAMLCYQLALPFVLTQRNYSLLIESFCPPFTTAFLPFFSKKPVVGLVHMLAADDMQRKYKLPFHLVQNAGLKGYKHIIVTSEEMKRRIDNIHPFSKINVISNGIDSVSKPIFPKMKYVLFLGRIEVDQKGIDLLVSIFSKFHKIDKTYKLIIAGTGSRDEIAQLREIIKKEKITDSVTLRGKVSGTIKAELLRSASCIVIPSRFETYSLVALEALAYGTPVVAFAIPGLRWLSPKFSQKVKAFDLDGMLESIRSVLNDSKQTRDMIKNGTDYAKQFTWDAIAKQYLTVIESILRKNT